MSGGGGGEGCREVGRTGTFASCKRVFSGHAGGLNSLSDFVALQTPKGMGGTGASYVAGHDGGPPVQEVGIRKGETVGDRGIGKGGQGCASAQALGQGCRYGAAARARGSEGLVGEEANDNSVVVAVRGCQDRGRACVRDQGQTRIDTVKGGVGGGAVEGEGGGGRAAVAEEVSEGRVCGVPGGGEGGVAGGGGRAWGGAAVQGGQGDKVEVAEHHEGEGGVEG
jgi:hypothetical protein